MPLTRQTYSASNIPSILKDLPLEDFDLKKANSALFAKNAKKLRNQFKTTLTSKEAVLIHYDPTLSEALLPNTLRTKEVVDKDSDPSAKAWRHFTKHRLVTSKVTGYMITRGERTAPFPIIITTACAPNAMGSSPKDLEHYFSDQDPGLSNYKQMMLLTYKRILYAQITYGTQVLIIPPIGLGLYLSQLSELQQAKAIEINYHALREAIESIGQWGKLQEIICVAPNNNNQNKYLPKAHTAFLNCYPPIPTTFVPADALETAQKLTANGYQVGIVNAGSDRTIGGAYTTIKPSRLPPMEETLSQATDLVYIQAQDKSNSNYQYIIFPGELCCSGPSSSAKPWYEQPSGCKKNQEDFKPKELGIAIKQWLEQKNSIVQSDTIIITRVKHNFKIFFQTSEQAQLFANKLQNDVQIGSLRKPGQAKCVQKELGYFLVYLTSKDMKQLTEFIRSRVNQNHNSKTTEKLQEEGKYTKFKAAYKEALKKDQRVCIFGFFRRSNMDFSKCLNMQQVEEYIRQKPKSRSARVYNNMKPK
jgi:hypothetical protein